MRILLTALLAVGCVLAKAGTDTAVEASLEKGPFTLAIAAGTDIECPPTWDLRLAADMPDPGWSLRVDDVVREKDGRFVVKVTAAREPGMHAQVITERTAVAKLGHLRKGSHLVEIRYRRLPATSYDLVQAAVVRGR